MPEVATELVEEESSMYDRSPCDVGVNSDKRITCAERLATSSTSEERFLLPVVVGVDDTDDATKATSTGAIASLIAKAAVDLGGQVKLGITRHQLLLRDDVPYTSHNSAMVFEALMPPNSIDKLKVRAVKIIEANRAETSDPGFCIACLPMREDREVTDANYDISTSCQIEELVAFGQQAKTDFCSKKSAYALTASIPWVHLSEHGGDGAGVVGALAGVGLRLGGEDGRFRGKWNLVKFYEAGEPCNVGEVARRLSRAINGPVLFVDSHGNLLPSALLLSLQKEAKPILYRGALTVVCDIVEGVAHPRSKLDLGEIGNEGASLSNTCKSFTWDNDLEECFDRTPSCKNCLHRRWIPDGFVCAK